MSETIATTIKSKSIVKKIVVGTPVRRVTSGAFSVNNLDGFDVENRTDLDIFVYDSNSGNYVSSALEFSGGLSKSYDRDSDTLTITLDATGVTAGSYGTDSNFPYFTVDSQGQLSFAGVINLNTNFITEGDNNLFYTDARVMSALDSISTSIRPEVDGIYDLGDSNLRFRDLYLSGNTIYIGGLKVQDEETALTVTDSAGNPAPIIFGSLFASDSSRIDDNLSVKDDLLVGGNLTTSGSLIINDSAVVTGVLTVQDSAQFQSNVSIDSNTLIGGTLTVNGLTTINNNILVTDSAQFSSAVDIADSVNIGTNLSVNNDVLIGNSLQVNNDLTVTDSVQIGGNTSINGNTLLGGTLDVNDSAHFATNASVTNNVLIGNSLQVNNNLNVADSAHFSSNVSVDSDVLIGGNLRVNNVLTTDDLVVLDSARIGGNGSVGGTLLVGNDLVVNDSAQVLGNASIDGNLNVGGNINTNGYISGPATMVIDPAGIGDNTGKLVVKGDLQIDGTTTTINSTTLTVEDKNIVLAQNALNPLAADGAGITINDGIASITYSAGTDRWVFDKTIYADEGLNVDDSATFGSEVSITGDLNVASSVNVTDAVTADTLTGEYLGFDSDLARTTTIQSIRGYFSANGDLTYDSATGQFSFDVEQVYTKDNFDSDLNLALETDAVTTTDLTEGDNLYYTRNRFDSALGDTTSIDTIRGYFGAAGDLTYDSATGVFQFDVEQVYTKDNFDSDLNLALSTDAVTTTDLTEGDNLYYTRGRFDSALGDSLSTQTIRDYFSAGGDLSYNSTTGQFFFDVEDVYTQANFDSDFNTSLDAAAIDGVGLAYDASSNTLSIDSAELAAYYSTNDITEGDNLYYTRARFDSALGDSLSTQTIRDYFSAAGDLSYSPTTGTFSIDVEEIYTAENFDSDLDAAVVGGIGINYNTVDNTINIDSAELAAYFSTNDITEGDNLYYTKVRVDSDIEQGFNDRTTDALAEGSNLYYTRGRFDSALGDATSIGTIRGYFTGGLNLVYDSATGVFTLDSDISITGDLSARQFLSTNTTLAAPTAGNYSGERVRLYDFEDSNIVNYAIGVEANNIWMSVDTNSPGQGFKWYGDSVQVARLNAVGDLEISGDFTAIDVSVNNITTDGYIQLDGDSANPAYAKGRLFYDTDANALSYYNEASDVTVNVAQEFLIRIKNTTGQQINNGQAVYITGQDGGVPTVTLSQSNDINTQRVDGVATHDIVDNAIGYITRFGVVNDVNTGGLAAGSDLYLSKDSAGQFSGSSVSLDSGYPIHIGKVLLSDSTAGKILVDPWTEAFEYLRIDDDLRVDGSIRSIGTITGKTINLDGTVPAYSEGTIFYDSANGTFGLYGDESEVTLQVGQEEWLRVYNNTGSTIPNGAPVYIAGEQNGLPSIALAAANADATVHAIGLATHAIETASIGYVTTRGVVNDINTTAFSSGDKVHVGITPGTLSTTAPTYPNYSVDIGYALTIDSAGSIYVDVIDHVFEVARVTGDARVDGDLTVAGNFNLLGTETITQVANLQVADNFVYIGAGDTVITSFAGTGTNDATFKDYYTGDSAVEYNVEIIATDSAGAGGDTIKWYLNDDSAPLGFDSAGGPTSWSLGADGNINIPLRYNITIDFVSAIGHDSGDRWYGDAAPVNVDLGLVGNYNTPDAPYTHAGVFRDASDQKFKIFNKYDPEVEGSINTTDSSFELATAVVNQLELSAGPNQTVGKVIGDLTGLADRAKLLDSAQDIAISGDITAAGVAFNGGSNITLSAQITAGSIVNADINAAAAIADTKLATISTAGKVQNSATTATDSNVGSTIVERDISGNFSAGTITANLTGQVSDISNHTTDDLAEGSTNLYYTTTRADSDFDVRLATKSTTDLTEGDNLYYTKVRVDSDVNQGFADRTTTDLVEGDNLYYTTARADSDAKNAISVVDNGGDGSLSYNNATGEISYTGPSAAEVRAHFSAAGDLSYDSATGQFSFDVEQVYTKANFDSDLGDANTGQLPEGSNLYYTKVRVDSDVNQGFADRTTSDLAEGVNLYYTTLRADSDFDVRLATKTTDDLTEGSVNIYYTTARHDSDFAVSLAGSTTTDLAEGVNLYYTKTRTDSDIQSYLIGNAYATEAYVDSNITVAVNNIIDGAPAALDTLNELAAALNDDSDFAGTVTASLATKFNTADFNSTFDTQFGLKSTDSLSEGSTNLYYTDARVESLVDSAYVQARQAAEVDPTAIAFAIALG